MAKEFKKRDLEYHPVLLQQSSAHYDTNGQSNILDFERENSIEGAFGAISYNLIKYKNRQKGQDNLDNKKIERFKAWYELLQDLLEMGYQRQRNLRSVMAIEYPNMKYNLVSSS